MARRRLELARAIVTGASSGIGWQLTLQLAQNRVNVIATARRREQLAELQEAARSLPGNVHTVAGDITDSATRTRLLDVAKKELGGLDILINNAGITALGPFPDAQAERLRQVFEVNFFALAEMSRAAIPLLKEGRQPLIVNVGSVLGHRAVPLKTEYCASKFAVHGFSDALRAELVADQIQVLLVSPSTTDSDLFERAVENLTPHTNWKKGGAMPPAVVARKTVRAIETGRSEIILSTSGKLLVWLDRLCPPLANWIVARYAQ